MIDTTSKTQVVLNQVLADFRQQYRERYIATYANRLNGLQGKLKSANFDINKSHPYPNGNQSRKTYVQAKNEYDWAHRVTEKMELGSAPGDEQKNYWNGLVWVRHESYHPNAPRYVQIKQSAWESARKEAISAADASIDGYIAKLASKIAKDAVEATYNGELWFGSVLTVVCEDGEKQVWNTKCILNVSCLGTVFNQWPTRRTS